MPTPPSVTNVTPTTVHLKKKNQLTVHGENFVGDGNGNCSVKLTSSKGYSWAPCPAVGSVKSSQVIQVEATPTSDDEEKGTGTGDLTTTVTNGDGSGPSTPQTQKEDYVSD